VVSNINDFRKRESVTIDLLRECLSGTRLPDDPLDVSLPPGSERWPGAMRERLTSTLTPAGVLIPVMDRDRSLSVLLMEEHDMDVGVTALRETHEEVGIEPQHVSVIGYLAPMPTITGYAVTPVVGVVSDSAELLIDRTEVEYTFEVPLEFLLDESNDRLVDREFQGRSFPMVEFHYEGQRIWGATAQMLLIFRKILKNK